MAQEDIPNRIYEGVDLTPDQQIVMLRNALGEMVEQCVQEHGKWDDPMWDKGMSAYEEAFRVLKMMGLTEDINKNSHVWVSEPDRDADTTFLRSSIDNPTS